MNSDQNNSHFELDAIATWRGGVTRAANNDDHPHYRQAHYNKPHDWAYKLDARSVTGPKIVVDLKVG